MPGAGDLRERVGFWVRGLDENDDRLGPEAEQFVRSAQAIPLRGGEAVLAGRLAGTKPTVIVVREDSQTRTVDTDWKLRIAEGLFKGDYEIRQVAPNKQRGFLDFTVEAAA
jgi:hypothetical protein